MEKIQRILPLVLIFLSLTVFGQEEKQGLFKVTSTGFSFGFAGAGTAYTNEDYNNLAGSVVDKSHFIKPSDYNYSNYNFGAGGNVNPKIYLGITPYCKKKGEYRNDRELRISIGSGAGIRRNFAFYKYDNFNIDKFESPTTGNEVYADSSIYNKYIYTENFFDFNIGLAFFFKTNVERRVHFAAGVGVEYAYAFRSFVNIRNYTDRNLIYYDMANKPVYDEKDSFYNYDKDDDNSTTKSFKTNMDGSLHFFRTLFPLNLNFRISNKTQSFFNHVYLMTEMSPGIEFQKVSGDKTYVNPYFGVAMLGFTYRW